MSDPTNDDPIWLLRVASERTRQRHDHPEEAPCGFGPHPESTFRYMATAIELDSRDRQSKRLHTQADILLEEVCEFLREQPGTEKYEQEAVQVAAVALRIASASRKLRTGGR